MKIEIISFWQYQKIWIVCPSVVLFCKRRSPLSYLNFEIISLMQIIRSKLRAFKPVELFQQQFKAINETHKNTEFHQVNADESKAFRNDRLIKFIRAKEIISGALIELHPLRDYHFLIYFQYSSDPRRKINNIWSDQLFLWMEHDEKCTRKITWTSKQFKIHSPSSASRTHQKQTISVSINPAYNTCLSFKKRKDSQVERRH